MWPTGQENLKAGIFHIMEEGEKHIALLVFIHLIQGVAYNENSSTEIGKPLRHGKKEAPQHF